MFVYCDYFAEVNQNATAFFGIEKFESQFTLP